MSSIHFDRTILYKEDPLDVHFQCLSSETPMVYAVWPKDEKLKRLFDNTFVLFTKSIKSREEAQPTTWHQVHYSKNAKSADLDFEFSVWNELEKQE